MTFSGIEEGVITGQQRDFEITVTNLGPDTAIPPGDDFFFVFSSIISSNEDWIPDIFFELDEENSPPECFFSFSMADPIPGYTPNYVFDFIFFQLQPLESITCKGKYTIYFEAGERTVDWNLINNLTPDPDLSNNSVSITFGLRPVSVPVNASWGLLLLSVLIGLLAIGTIQRQQAGFDKTSASKT